MNHTPAPPPVPGAHPDDDSVAGEEDPGASLDDDSLPPAQPASPAKSPAPARPA